MAGDAALQGHNPDGFSVMPFVIPHRHSAYRLRNRRGYTLLELLIALGILAAIAGLTLPSLRGPLDKSRLRHSARQVQSALAKTRALAIRAGEAHSFRYEIGRRNFHIETFAPAAASSGSGGLLESEHLPGEPSHLPDADMALSLEPVLRTVRTGQLPDGVVFAISAKQNTTTGTAAASALAIEEPAAVAMIDSDSNGGMLSRWSEPVRFAPNGRAMDATIRVRGSREFHIDVSLRGLTGMSSYSSPQRSVPATQNTSTEDESGELTLNAGVNSGGLQ
jgi:prepilin-type N-terminal cleavage/methylation domain-containing protein